MFDCILINGDSYSAKKSNQRVYGDFLQEQLGLPVYNIAWQGSNNQRIIRSTLENLHHYKNPLELVGWSFIRRMEVWYYGTKKSVLNGIPDVDAGIDISKHPKFVTLDVLMQENEATLEQKCLINDDLFVHKQLMNFYTNIYLLSQFLKNNNMQYFFFSAANNSEIPIHSFPAIENLDHVQSVIRDNNIYRLHDFYVKAWSDLNDPDSMDLTGHMSVTGHEKFAGFLLNLLNNNLS